MPNQLTYKRYGERAIMIEWPAIINEEILNNILQFKELIPTHKREIIEECISGYNSLTIIYLDDINDFLSEKQSLELLYDQVGSHEPSTNYLWKIPVCYELEFGIDLNEVSTILNLSTQEIIDLHSQTLYTVYFIGFLPGFLYLGGLDSRLKIRRKPNPRLHVEKGSVAIGGCQTGIYPMDSAGGWNILGKTPLSFFDVNKDKPCFAKAGDKIQFVPITMTEYKKLEIETKLGIHEPSKEILNG